MAGMVAHRFPRRKRKGAARSFAHPRPGMVSYVLSGADHAGARRSMKDLIEIAQMSPKALRALLDLGHDLKRRPAHYARAMEGRTLCMLFEKPSLRTRVSFETGMSQLGGHAIHYDLGGSPFGAGKESIADTARTLSRYVDVIMARLFAHRDLLALAKHATVPVINGLTDDAHPTQALADLLTIEERTGRLAGRTLAYLGDGHNNVTHSLLAACAKTGMHVRVASPPGHAPEARALRRAQAFARASGATIQVTERPAEAVRGADVVYTDTWMSYHIPEEQKPSRMKLFLPYQVNAALMRRAQRNAIFLHCLPAQRGCEVTDEVMDGPASAVFDQAENRLHMHKAVMLTLRAERA
jgi:ornithine carbamoyltransferase